MEDEPTRGLDPASAALLQALEVEPVGPPTHDELRASRLERPDPKLAGLPEPVALRADVRIELGGRGLPARLYRGDLDGRRPILLWLHGGGFVGGSLADIETTCAALAHRSGAIVVSLDYRLAPEHPFPAALEDTIDTLAWLYQNGAPLGGDGRLAIGGQSAGANLAAAAALIARERGPALEAQVLCYPALDPDQAGPSHTRFDGLFVDSMNLRWSYEQYLGGQPPTPLAFPLLAESTAGLPPALLVLASHDPLLDDGQSYAALLQRDGVEVAQLTYPGAIHAFLNFPRALPYAWQAIDDIAAYLRTRLAPPVEPAPALQHVTCVYERGQADELRRFYRDLLGLSELRPPDAFARADIVWFGAGDHQRELHFVPSGDAEISFPHFCLETDQLEPLAARLAAAGVRVERDDALPDRPRCYVHDPFGHLVELVSFGGPED